MCEMLLAAPSHTQTASVHSFTYGHAGKGVARVTGAKEPIPIGWCSMVGGVKRNIKKETFLFEGVCSGETAWGEQLDSTDGEVWWDGTNLRAPR